MRETLLQHSQFEVFILDEVDQCILEKGVATSEDLQNFTSFWDILLQRTVLMTATESVDMVNLHHDLLGVEQDSFLKFDSVINSTDKGACR